MGPSFKKERNMVSKSGTNRCRPVKAHLEDATFRRTRLLFQIFVLRFVRLGASCLGTLIFTISSFKIRTPQGREGTDQDFCPIPIVFQVNDMQKGTDCLESADVYIRNSVELGTKVL